MNNASYDKSFDKMAKKLPQKIRDKFRERLNIFIQNKFDPILDNHSVHPIYPNCRSINVTGDFRAIFYEVGSEVTFVAIGTHAQLYK